MGLDSGLLVAPANPQRTNCPNSELSSSQWGVSPLPPPTASHELQRSKNSKQPALHCSQLPPSSPHQLNSTNSTPLSASERGFL